MKSAKIVPHYSIEELLEKVQYWVEATRTEQFFLWKMHSETSDVNGIGCEKLDFITGNYGVGFYSDPINGTNIRTCVMVSPFLLNGVLCAFYEATSQVVAWDKVEKYLSDNAPNYNGKHSDAMNFSQCINFTIK